MLPTSTDEQEETFSVFLTSSTGSVLLDPTLNRVVITVEQNGSPFGIISFLGEALSPQRVDEQSTLSLPLERNGDLSVAVDVTYTVSRVPGNEDPVSLDVTPAAGVISFPVLQGRTSIDLVILTDNVAEPDETFIVTLTGTTGGASINPQANTATFVIKLVDLIINVLTTSCIIIITSALMEISLENMALSMQVCLPHQLVVT